MKLPAKPADEAARLEVLHRLRVLDSQAEATFDALARTASRHLGTPIGLVSLIDSERQWFKAAIGLALHETPRDIAFCAHTILQDEPLVVEDAALDERFCDNPLVTGPPGVRFYAGVPLRAGGHRVGTLCVLDRVPRAVRADELALLGDLSIIASELLEERLRQPSQPGAPAHAGADAAPDATEVPDGLDRLKAAVFDADAAHVAILDADGTILQTNAAWQRFARDNGYRDDPSFRGVRYLDVLEHVHGVERAEAMRARAGIVSVLDGTADQFEMEYACHTPAQAGWFLMRVAPSGSVRGGAVVSHGEITRHKLVEQSLSRLAYTDPLTGVGNRRWFLDVAAYEVLRAVRYGQPLAVMMVDLDHFKSINDRYGHAAGDDVLAGFARIAAGVLRESDIMGRLGGEEFAVLLPNATREGACALAERLLGQVRAQAVQTAGASVRFTVSIGVAVLGRHGGSIEALLAAADAALYQAKRAGRDRIETAPPQAD